MQGLFVWFFKALRRVVMLCSNKVEVILCRMIFYGQNVQHKSFNTIGLPYVSVAFGGKCTIGAEFNMNNKLSGNPIGRPQHCVLFIDKHAKLSIGNNVGISQTAIVCHVSITIGNDVKIGGGVCIYDTDFHSLDPMIRKDPKLDLQNKIKKPVVIKDNAFIGAHSTILKGVTIGENSIVGACSVVTKDIPDNQIWAGNPARMIKDLDSQKAFNIVEA